MNQRISCSPGERVWLRDGAYRRTYMGKAALCTVRAWGQAPTSI